MFFRAFVVPGCPCGVGSGLVEEEGDGVCVFRLRVKEAMATGIVAVLDDV